MARMIPAALTRRRDPDARQEKWLIFFGDVQAGRIALRSGNPNSTPAWEWGCGFYPGSRPGECSMGTAATFDQARAAFEAAWRAFLAMRTEADFEEWRRHQGFDRWRRRMCDAGCRLPTQVADGHSTCFCGASIGIADVENHVYAEHIEC